LHTDLEVSSFAMVATIIRDLVVGLKARVN
jgi:hypothetical protein